MPYPMPLISRSVPAFSNDALGGNPASKANNGIYLSPDLWRCAAQPTGGANSGVLCQSPGFTVPFPVWLAYDLSGVPTSQRQQVLLAWYNEPQTGAYRPDLISNSANNLPTVYTIDINTAAGGGSPPVSGWTTVASVTDNLPFTSRQHVFNMAGANWVRIYITQAIGSTGNNSVALNMDVHDAHLGIDSVVMFGDSITTRGADHDDTPLVTPGIGPTIPQQITSKYPGFYPVIQDASIGGWTATDLLPFFASWLALFPGKYVIIDMGGNDANQGGAYLTNYQSNMTNMVQQVLAAGKIPIVGTIHWMNPSTQTTANVITLNSQIASIIAANPGTLSGADMYTWFLNNPGDLSSDHIHPTDPALGTGNGYVDWRTVWVNWFTANLYNNVLSTPTRTAFKVRTVLKTPTRSAFKVRAVLKTLARTAFKIQLGSAVHQPYQVSSAYTHLTERPFSTIQSKMVVTDASGAQQNSMTATVTVTYPDNSTSTPQVYWLGSGVYSIIYETKGAGTVSEVWVFTDAQGSQAEYKNLVACAF